MVGPSEAHRRGNARRGITEIDALRSRISEAHDVVLTFRKPQPSAPTAEAITAWISGGVRAVAINAAWWRKQPHAPKTAPQPRAHWEAALIARLTETARCYLGY